MASAGGLRGQGGIASLVTYLADALPGRLPGLRVDVLDTYGPGAFWLMPFYFIGAVAKLIIARLRGHVDLVHIHMACYGSAVRKQLLAIVAIAMGIPTVMHLNGADFDDYSRALAPWRRRLLVWVLKHCVRVAVVGKHWRDLVVSELGIDPTRVVLIYNGAPPLVRPEPKKASGGGPALLMLGQLGIRKGTPELISALATPELRRCEWSAILAGDGPVGQFRAVVDSLDLSDRIRLPGWQSAGNVRNLLWGADIFVLPSRAEGLPLAIMEAMAAGLPVISTPVGGIPDAIIDGETGLLVPPGDVPALANAIRRLLDDLPLRERLGVNAHDRFDRLFAIDRTADAVAELYRPLGIA